MRVNHVGEVCAQACTPRRRWAPRSGAARAFPASQPRGGNRPPGLDPAGSTNSAPAQLLNPLWYAGAFGLGLVASRLGDRLSLGFVVETERQVEAHLASHLERLPLGDHESRAIVAQMKDDEALHALRRRTGRRPCSCPSRSRR
jgi:ubiquinone biosynthesis monooxygenase Coq7